MSRTEAQRDRDRILYSSAFQRLGNVTQVAAPEAGYMFHSRLTHSLKVAQLARRLAERFKIQRRDGLLSDASAKLVDLLDEDSVEAAALGHDLGHPPFGHLAEQELQEQAKQLGSFEGNAQSFRIVTALAIRSTDLTIPGLNLTRRTLNGLLKYPWLRDAADDKKKEKWGAYDVDEKCFDWAREGTREDERTLEAMIMDWADDVTYAVHDLDDFYRAGLLPMERLVQPRGATDEGREFADYLRHKRPQRAGRLIDAAERVFGFFPFEVRYRGRVEERAALRAVGSSLITRYVDTVELIDADDATGAWFTVGDNQRDEIDVMKQLIWFYVIERPALATIQRGQREVVAKLYEIYEQAAIGERAELRMFPLAIAERIARTSDEDERRRAVVDLIAGMTEESAHAVFMRATGSSPGSLLASANGPA